MRHKHQIYLLLSTRINLIEAMKEIHILNYYNSKFIQKEIQNSKNLFKKYRWPAIDVIRKSVKEIVVFAIRIYKIKKKDKR